MTSSDGNIFRVTGLLYGEFIGHRWIPRTKASDAELSVIYVWTNNWENNEDASDLRPHRAHYDVIVVDIANMAIFKWTFDTWGILINMDQL